MARYRLAWTHHKVEVDAMKFSGSFQCSKCGESFTIELGPQAMGEMKTPKKIGDTIAAIAKMMAESCKDHESNCKSSPLSNTPYFC